MFRECVCDRCKGVCLVLQWQFFLQTREAGTHVLAALGDVANQLPVLQQCSNEAIESDSATTVDSNSSPLGSLVVFHGMADKLLAKVPLCNLSTPTPLPRALYSTPHHTPHTHTNYSNTQRYQVIVPCVSSPV